MRIPGNNGSKRIAPDRFERGFEQGEGVTGSRPVARSRTQIMPVIK